MSILIAIVVGGLVGWLASIVMKTNQQMGILANIVVGIIGSALGSWLAGLLGLAAFGFVGGLIVSVLGAIVLIAILKALKILK
jgi:uncharacterized membrane protein YeaQ/YmgE (transglycosylase-associated protein family)